MSHGLYDRCECGHRHPEHSLFGICHGCLDCPVEVHPMDDDPTAEDPATAEDGGQPVDDSDVGDESDDEPEDEHPYRPCDCTRFRLIETDEPDGAPGP